MHFCLTKDQTGELIAHLVEGKNIEDEDFSSCVEMAKAWECELVALSYLFANIVERVRRDGGDTSHLIQTFFSISESYHLNFEIQGFNAEFNDFLLRSLSIPALQLEEKLIEVQTKLVERRYNEIFKFSSV